MATALKLRSDIKKLKKALEAKGISASIKDKLKSQLEKAENELNTIQKTGKAPKKSSTAKTKTVLSAVQKLANRKRYSVYKGAGVDLKKDAEVGAMPTGKRISKGLKSNQHGDKSKNKGNVYYEYRPNRLDVKQPKKKQKYPKLEDGGTMADGGEMDVVNTELIKVKGNLMGTTSLELKIKGMRKSQDFIVYPISADQAGKPITIQSDTRFGYLDLNSGRGLMSQSHPNGAYSYHFASDKKVPFKISETDVQKIKEHLVSKAGSKVGNRGIFSDNSGADKMASGGMMASGGTTKGRYKINVYFGGEMEDEVLYANTIEEARKIASRGEHSEIYDSVTRKFVYASGGSVKSGESVPYIIWVSKDDDKREFYGEYKSKRAAEMAMNKLWDSGEYQSMGNKPKSMYEKEGFYAKGGKLNAGHKIKYQGKDAKIVSQKGDMYFVEVMNYHPNGDSMFTVLRKEEIGKFAAGGYMENKEKLIKELQRLQRELNSSRLSKYREGDTSEEEISRQRERESKLNRFNEILKVLNEDDKMAAGGYMADGGYVVRNLGGDRYDGGLAYEITKDGKVVQEGLIDGEMPIQFEGKSYDGLLALSEGIGAKLEVSERDDDYYAAGGEVILMEDYYGKSARVPLGFDVFTVEWQGDRPLKDNVVISDNGFRTIDKNSALFSQVYLTLLKAMKENKVKVMKDGGYMAHGGQIKAGQYVIVDNPYWKAAMGVEKPVRRRVKKIDGENVFFSDGSNSSIQYVKKLQDGGFLADGGILSNTHKLA